MARILAIANQKGGVGKTTTAINFAASLAVAEQRVLLIDLDPQANTTSGSGAKGIEARNVYHVLLGEAEIGDILRSTELANLAVVPSTPDLIGFEVEAIDLENREGRLRASLNKVRDQYDFIVIDCPPSLGLLTVNALTAADAVVVPLQAEYFALEGLGRLMGTIELIRAQLNPTLEVDGILLTMFDRRNNLAKQVAQEVETHFPTVLFKTRIPRNVKISEAPSFGKPIILYDIRSVGAQNYLALAQEYLERIYRRSAGELSEVSNEVGKERGTYV